jgi:hypothetical protein
VPIEEEEEEEEDYIIYRGTALQNRKVSDSIPDGVNENFH